VRQKLVDLLAPLVHEHVTGAGVLHEIRLIEARRHPSGVKGRRQVVARPDGDDHGHAEAGKWGTFLEAEHLADELSEDLRLDRTQHAQGPCHLRRTWAAAKAHPGGQVARVGRRQALAGPPDPHPGAGDEADGAGEPAPAQNGQAYAGAGRDESERPHSGVEHPGLKTRQAQAHHAPHGVADQHRPLDPEGGEHLGNVHGHGRDSDVVLPRAREPMAAQVHGDDAVVRVKVAQLIAPHLGGKIRPVQQEDGGPVAHLDQVGCPAVPELQLVVNYLGGQNELGVLGLRRAPEPLCVLVADG